MCSFLPPGKLPLEILSGLLRNCTAEDERVLVGPEVGEDAAVIDFGKTCLVVKTDPITFATDEIGHYAVHVNANDVATMGAVPRWFLATLLLPENQTHETLVRTIFDSLRRATREIGVTLCGGHTEITAGLDRPIVVGQMLGEVSRDNLVRSSGLQVGDGILLTKGLGIEATAILAREKEAELLDRGFDPDLLEKARGYLRDPGISILKEARIACETASVHAMHDPTEGGVSTALRELAAASNRGLSVDAEALFASEETRLLCDAFQLDPLGVISSGALLLGLAPEDAGPVRNAIRAADIPCEIIGRVESREFGLRLREDDRWNDLPEFDRDEIGKIF